MLIYCISYEFWSMAIRFNYADIKLSGVNKTSLKNMVIRIFKEEELALEHIDYIFCSDEFLLNINRSALSHDYYTDIITFSDSTQKHIIAGDILISIDRVRENANKLKIPFVDELHRVIVHGILHLMGYKDKSKKDQQQMRKMEDRMLYLRKNG